MTNITPISIICGGLITVSATAGVLLNLKVLYVLCFRGFLDSRHSSIYIIAFINIYNATVLISVSAFYLGPTSIMQVRIHKLSVMSVQTKEKHSYEL